MATAHQPQPPRSRETLSQEELTELMEIFTREEVTPKFKGQSRGKQYAVVDFWSSKDFLTGFRDHFSHATVDSTQMSMPPVSDFTSFIVARPLRKRKGKVKHAERIILNQLDNLYMAYKLFSGESPLVIYLYSYLMPCTKCASAIADKLSTHPYSNILVLLAYSQPYQPSKDFTSYVTLRSRGNIKICQVS